MHGSLRPQADPRTNRQLGSRSQIEIQFQQYRGDDQRCLEGRQAGADAQPRSAAEREVHELRPRCRTLGKKSIRIECEWIVPVARRSMRNVRRNQQEAACRDMKAAEVVVGDCGPREPPAGWVEPQRLVKHTAEKWHIGHARGGWRLAVEDLLDFLSGPRAMLGV